MDNILQNKTTKKCKSHYETCTLKFTEYPLLSIAVDVETIGSQHFMEKKEWIIFFFSGGSAK